MKEQSSTTKKRALNLFLIAALLLTMLAPALTSAASDSVSDFDGLKAALASSDSDIEIVVTDLIVMTAAIEIPEGKNVTITSTSSYAGLKRGAGVKGNLITVLADAQLTLFDIVIDGNKNEVDDAGGSLIKILGGGELVLCKGAALQNNNRGFGSGGAVYSLGSIKMYGGTISGNTTDLGNGFTTTTYGGGIAIFAGTAEIYGGTITDNTSFLGGGIYTDQGTTTTIYNALITENSADYMGLYGAGGGMWICATGNAMTFDFRSVAIYDNSARTSGQDIHSINKSSGQVSLSNGMLGGGTVTWINEATGSPLIIQNHNTELDITAQVDARHKTLAAAAANVVITNNTGIWGGGMAANGVVRFGEPAPELIDLVVKKEWVGGNAALRPAITVYLVVDGVKKDSQFIVLNAGNSWQSAFTNLPYKDGGRIVEYAVEENVPVGYGAGYSDLFVNTAGQYEIVITNSRQRSSEPAYLPLTGTKTANVDFGDGQFAFTLTADDNNPEEGGSWDGNNPVGVSSDGTIDLGMLAFTQIGTYIFTIHEQAGSAGGWSYDPHDVTVTAEVEEIDGQLTVTSVSYSKNGAAVGDIRFSNTYTTTAATLPLSGTKTANADFEDGQFTFTLTADDNNPAGGGSWDGNNPVDVSSDGTIDLGTLTFAKTGSYKFTIHEQFGGAANWSYDTKAVTVTVVVQDIDSQLTVTSVAYSKDGASVAGIRFENTYIPGTVTLPLSGVKTANDDFEDGQFTFTLMPGAGNPAGGANWDGSNPVRVSSDGTIDLGTLTFTKAGAYIFTIRERAGSATDWIYDTDDVTVTVVVNDVEGQLTVASVTYQKGGEDADGIYFDNIHITGFPERHVDLPETGDGGNFTLMLIVSIVSLCVAVAAGFKRRKNNSRS